MENLNEPKKKNSILLKVVLAVIAVLWIICMLFNFNVLPWKLNFNIVNNKTENTTKTENIKLESTAISHDEK